MAIKASPLQIGCGIVLIITGYVAAVGMTLACAVRNQALYGSADPPFALQSGMPLYLAAGGITLIWIVAASLFALRSKNAVSRVLVAAAAIVFVLSSVNVLRFAYPVCNAF